MKSQKLFPFVKMIEKHEVVSLLHPKIYAISHSFIAVNYDFEF